jgi:pectate lyase
MKHKYINKKRNLKHALFLTVFLTLLVISPNAVARIILPPPPPPPPPTSFSWTSTAPDQTCSSAEMIDLTWKASSGYSTNRLTRLDRSPHGLNNWSEVDSTTGWSNNVAITYTVAVPSVYPGGVLEYDYRVLFKDGSGYHYDTAVVTVNGPYYYHWKMNELDGTTLRNSGFDDVTGTYHNVGMGDYLYGPEGYCKYFVPTDPFYSYIDVQNSELPVPLNGDLTISLWVQLKNIGEARLNPIDKYYGGEFALTIETSGGVNFYQGKVGGGYVGIGIMEPNSLKNNVWYHIAVTRDISSKTIRSYLNGQPMVEATYTDPVPQSTNPIMIGRGYTGNGVYGRIDDVRIDTYVRAPAPAIPGDRDNPNFWRAYSLKQQLAGFGENTQIPDITEPGIIYYVTGEDNEEIVASLEYALEDDNERFIVFSDDVDDPIILDRNIVLTSNKVLDGRGHDITIKEYGFLILETHDIIVENIAFDEGYKFTDPENDEISGPDAIGISENSYNIFIDHCSFQDYGDGLVDIKKGSKDITVSWCKFTNHYKISLIGIHEDITPETTVTFHHNYFSGTQRMPMVTGGQVHMFNNFIHWFDDEGRYSYAGACYEEGELYYEDNIFLRGTSGDGILFYHYYNESAGIADGYIKTAGNLCKKQSIWPWDAYDVNDFQNNPDGVVFSPCDFYQYADIDQSAFNDDLEYDLFYYTGSH